MVLKLFFDISTSFRFSKDQCECTLHSEAPPWLNTWGLIQSIVEKRSVTPPNFILEQQTESHMKAEVFS